VDAGLLNTYINYQMETEAIGMLKKAGKNIEFLAPKMDKKEFDLMIENYLTNERNMIISRAYLIKNSSLNIYNQTNADMGLPPGLGVIPDDGPPPPFSGSGNFGGSTITNIVFTGKISSNGTISQSAFGFAGVHGTITKIGSLSQAVYNGVTTYQQKFQEVVNLANGTVYTQLFVVYGNIYGSSVTVTGMLLP
jgi:hypothetical protein